MGILEHELLINVTAVLVTLVVTVIAYFHYAYKYWERKGVPYLQPKFPLGNTKTIFPKSSTMGLSAKEFYYELKKRGHKFGGIYLITRPCFVAIDPDYLKDIMSQDFQYFIDRGVYHNEKNDPISCHMFNTDEKHWKNIRVNLTPTFTSGKMKMMFNTVTTCSTYMDDFLAHKAKNNLDIDIKDVVASFTTDVIGACAFGINCNSFTNTEAEFREMGRKIFQKNIIEKLKAILILNLPELSLKLGFCSMRKDISDFFFRVVKQTVKYREENNILRPDFLQLLIDMRNKEDSNFEMNSLVAQVFLFFIAGFDTSSATMTFTLYELSRHPEIQEKVRNEISDVLEKTNGEVTYESLSEMKYLQQVIDETLRLYPPLVTLTRKCVQDYKLRNTDIVIEKGTSVIIPLYALQRDPDYFPDPDKFDPERFSSENKKNIRPYAYMPFGEGPRNCIGLRFGLMQSKIGLINILKSYRLSVSPSTKMPLELDPDVFLIRTTETLYLKAEKLT